MNIKDVEDYLSSVTPTNGLGDFWDQTYKFREVKTSLEEHFIDEETGTTDFQKIGAAVQDYVRFENKKYTAKQCIIELVEGWFHQRKQGEKLIDKIYVLCGNDVSIYNIHIEYGEFITDAYYLFKTKDKMYTLEFGAND